MGISIYYNANRGYPLTDEENNLIKNIVEKYNMNKMKKFKKGEDFQIYEYDRKEPKKIFAGSTGLATSIINPMITAKCCMFWAKCLTEIRAVIKDAEWSAQMDEDELIWDDKNGWHLEGFRRDDKKSWQFP